LRILQIYNDYRSGGGGESVVVKATRDVLAKHGHCVRMLERDSRAIVTLGDKMSAFAKGVYSWHVKQEVVGIIRQFSPDVVHVHNLYPLLSPSVLAACRELGTPVVMTVHNFRLTCPTGTHLHRGAICERCRGGHNYWCILNNCQQNIAESVAYALRTAVAQWLGMFKRNVALFIAPSQFVKTRLIEAGFEEGRVMVVPNSSPIPYSSIVPSQGCYVAFVGRISPEKGIDTLLGAARFTGLPVRIVGDGPIRPRLADKSSQNVEFVGPLDRASIGGFYRGARFAVLPSLWFEPCPLVAIEAMSHGLPVIASRIGGLPEIVEDGVTGFLFDPGNAEDLASKMRLLWENPDLCRQMGRAGREKSCREYSEDAYFKGLMAAYEKAVEICKDESASLGRPVRRRRYVTPEFHAQPRVEVLGVGIDPVNRGGLLNVVERLVERGGATVAYANAHVLNLAVRDPELRAFLNAADLCYCDGGGVRLGAWLLGEQLPERMTGADWIWDLAACAEGRWRLFWIGGEPGVAAAAAARLRECHPRLPIETEHGFHTDDDALLARVNHARPDIVLVGMGTPLQERWVATHRGRILAPVVWVLGATADFVSGKVPRGPAWLYERHEWLARLIAEPQRLWRRYLIGNSLFLGRVLAARLLRTRY